MQCVYFQLVFHISFLFQFTLFKPVCTDGILLRFTGNHWTHTGNVQTTDSPRSQQAMRSVQLTGILGHQLKLY